MASSISHADLTVRYALQHGNNLFLVQAARNTFFLKVTLLFRIHLHFQEIKGITVIFRTRVRKATNSELNVVFPAFQFIFLLYIPLSTREGCDGN